MGKTVRIAGPYRRPRASPPHPSRKAGKGPVGFVAGTADLVYEDPEDGGLVVADYKTDAVETDAEIDDRAKVYSSQGAIYARAVQEALNLDRPPRMEFWFLHPGRIVEA